jgi:hypothetical protein
MCMLKTCNDILLARLVMSNLLRFISKDSYTTLKRGTSEKTVVSNLIEQLELRTDKVKIWY